MTKKTKARLETLPLRVSPALAADIRRRAEKRGWAVSVWIRRHLEATVGRRKGGR